jgi:RNA polymerase-binding transcription factor DksA
MNQATMLQFKRRLEELAGRTSSDVEVLKERALEGSGGQAGGELSNSPTHLADAGSTEYLHELNSTLLENEAFLTNEAWAALERIEAGSFGTCERCGGEIAEERLDALPFTRVCFPCAEATDAGADVNLNAGRPERAPFLNEANLTLKADVERSTSETGSDLNGAPRRPQPTAEFDPESLPDRVEEPSRAEQSF